MRISDWSSDVCSSDLVFRTTDADLIWKVNLDGTRHLIAAMTAHAPDARPIMASTSHVYDADSPRPGAEEDRCSPTLAYPASRLAAETEQRASARNWSIESFDLVSGVRDGDNESLPRNLAHWDPRPPKTP